MISFERLIKQKGISESAILRDLIRRWVQSEINIEGIKAIPGEPKNVSPRDYQKKLIALGRQRDNLLDQEALLLAHKSDSRMAKKYQEVRDKINELNREIEEEINFQKRIKVIPN